MGPAAFLRWRARGFLRRAVRRVPRQSPATPPARVLCLVCGGIGDRLTTLPALRLLKQRYPLIHRCVVWIDGELDAVAGEFEEVRSGKWNALLSALRAPDMVFVSIQGVFSVWTEMCALASRAPIRIGPRSPDCAPGTSVYTDEYVFRLDRHVTRVNYDAVGGTHGDREPVPYPVSPAASSSPGPPGSSKPLVLLHPGVGKGYAIKQWPPDRFRKLAETIVSSGACRVTVSAGPGERDLAEFVAGGAHAHVLQAGSSTELFANAAQADLVVANDSGPAHAAAAINTPLVVLFGPTDPRRVAPIGPMCRILRAKCSCSPCFDHLPSCRRDRECMRSLSVDDVFRGVREALSLP